MPALLKNRQIYTKFVYADILQIEKNVKLLHIKYLGLKCFSWGKANSSYEYATWIERAIDDEV